MILGVISDTHGLMRPEALAALAGVDHIVHAGDVGRPAVLEALAQIAPVTAVRGNVDTEAAFADLPETVTLTLAGVTIHVTHILEALAVDPAAALLDVVVTGHSHRVAIAERGGVLYLNPGAAGARRFKLPVTLARLDLAVRPLMPDVVVLVPPPA